VVSTSARSGSQATSEIPLHFSNDQGVFLMQEPLYSQAALVNTSGDTVISYDRDLNPGDFGPNILTTRPWIAS
jgi:hypothetical protein